MALQEISEAEILSPQLQEISEAELLAPEPATPGRELKELLPLEDLQKEIDKGEFNALDYSADLNTRGEFERLSSDEQNNLVNAYAYQVRRGVTMDAVKRGIKQAPNLAAGIVKGAIGLPKRVGQAASAFVAGDAAKLNKALAETGAAVESGGLDTVEFGRGAIRKIGEKLGVVPSVDEMTPEQIRERFFTDLGHATQRAKVAQGQGAVAELRGLDAATLKEQGIELDTQAIADMSILTDPTNFVPAVGGLKIVNKLGKTVGFVRGVQKVEQAVSKVNSAIARGAGKVAAAPGKATAAIGKTLKSRAAKTGVIAGGAGLTGAVASGDPEAALKIAAGTFLAPIVIKHGGDLLEQVGKQTSKAGSLAERAASFTLNRAVKPAAAGAIVGGTMAVPLALLAENDDAAASLISGGVAFGALGNVAQRGAQDAGQALGQYLAEQYQTLSTRPKVESPGYGNPLDEVHQASIDALATERPADANVINTVREAFREITLPDGRKINTEVYLVPEDVKPPELSEEAFSNARAAGFWSGLSPEGKARIYLFKDATAVFHEPGHLIDSLIKLADPETHAALVQQVNESFPAPAREAFRDAYEQRLYGSTEGRINDETVTREILAESFSNMLRGHSLDGLPTPFRQRIATALGGFLEASGLYAPGVTPEGTTTTGPLEVAPGGVSPLGVGHSFKLSQLGSDFLSRLGVQVPEQTGAVVETPIRPAQPKQVSVQPKNVTVEPKKATAEQQKEDRQLKNEPPILSIEPGVDAKWSEAEALLQNSPDELQTLRSLRSAVDKPQGQVGPVRSPYFSVIEDSGQSPVERTARRMQQNIAAIREELGAVPEELREMVFKTHIPNRVIIRKRKDGSPNVNIVGTSVEKIAVNAVLAAREAAQAGVSIPIETRKGKITAGGFRQLFDALTKYTQNQMNGYAGDGSKVTVPENYESSIPPVNSRYVPQALDARLAQFINLLQGIEPPSTVFRKDRTKRFGPTGQEIKTPRNIEAARLARASGRPVLEAINVRRDKSGRPDANVFKETGETIKEFNPLRDEFAQKGVDLSKVLHESVEELSLEHFGGAVEPVQSALRGVSTPLATAGFMPVTERARELVTMDAEQWRDATQYKGKFGAGFTGYAYEIGAAVKTPEDLQALREAYSTLTEAAKTAMAAGQYGEALPFVSRAQAAREAYEAATGETLDGRTEATVPFMRKHIDPEYQPPIPGEAFKRWEEQQKAAVPAIVLQKAGFMPDPKPAKRETNADLDAVARKYAQSAGIEYQSSDEYIPVNEERAKRLADWYENAVSDPENPEVQTSYKAFIDETMKQYQALVDAGYKIEPWLETKGEPYKNSSEAVADIRDNKHLWFFLTENGFGTSGSPENHPLLADAGIDIGGKRLVYNDVFRAVHDLFGHGLKGNQFGPRGELNAWRDHAEMYSETAKPAMSAETLAQNSWVNFGRHLRDESGKIASKNQPGFIPLQERPFAEQKAVVLPRELIDEPAFSPARRADGEIIKAAAIRLPNGKIFEGRAHFNAVDEAQKLGELDPGLDYDLTDKYEAGFTTDKGRFVSREEAAAIAEGIGQVREGVASVGGRLESHAFRNNRAFMPKAKGKKKKFAASKELTSKSWILPNDEFVPLGSKWHHEWLQDNAADLNKRFKTKFDADTDPDERIDALNKGFTRINYERNSGTLHVETNKKWWTKQRKDTIFETVADNLADIDNMLVNVLNDDGSVADSGYARLFNYDDREKLEHLPLISEEGGFMPMWERDAADKYIETITPILSEAGFRADIVGSVKTKGASEKDLDIVLSSSVPISLEQALGRFFETVSPNLDAESDVSGPHDTVSGDWFVNVGLKDGRTVEFYFPANQFSQNDGFMPRRQESLGLGEVEVRPVYNREEIASLTRSGLRERFPEAVVTRKIDDYVDYDITGSPRFKKAKTEEAAVKDFADVLEAKYKRHADEPIVERGRKWYSEFTPLVEKLFGDESTEFIELLSATSPRNNPKQNFNYAVEAFEIWQRGGYDQLISKFKEGLSKLEDGSLEADYKADVPESKRPKVKKLLPGTLLAWWINKHDLIPKRDNGKLFGMNSLGVLKVVTRQWAKDATGLKTRQFVQNLLGTDHNATIDVWAGRTMREIGYKDFVDRWRVLPENDAPIRDPDFRFSQKVFAEAARRLGMKPSELQGAMWFLEKKLWEDNGWSKADYGSYQEPLQEYEVRRRENKRQENLDFEVKKKAS